MAFSKILLGVNVDHVATIRKARGTVYPDPLEAAQLAISGGADQITIHLREDRRHIVDSDLERMKKEIDVPLNLEMAAVDEIVSIACKIKPATATIVPEKRQELTTEGGLDVAGHIKELGRAADALKDAGVKVSFFIDPDEAQIEATLKLGVSVIELHTGRYCDAVNDIEAKHELERLITASKLAAKKGMKVAAGHGLNYDNTEFVVQALPEVSEYNIGHAIVARAIMVGMKNAVSEMKSLLGGRS